MGQDDLRNVIANLPLAGSSDLLVGNATGDDAAVLRIEGQKAIAQTVDFFTPIVDDPRLFGAIAAANSVSDIYAMGAEPILGLAIAAFPSDKLPLSILEEILAGGVEKATEAGFPVAGGHTIIDEIPKYGLAVTGIVDVDRIIRNSTAKAGDILLLTKPIGNGILVCAYRAHQSGRLRKLVNREAPSLDHAIEWMLRLNRDAADLMKSVGVHAATDITGYGLVGHLLEICEGSGTGARIRTGDVPVLEKSRYWQGRGFVPEGTRRNVASFRERVKLATSESDFELLCDAQTSGGLLVSLSPEQAARFEAQAEESGLFCARIGEMTERAGVLEIGP